MKETLYRVLPYLAMAMDLLMLWANVTDNDLFTLDHLRFQLMHLTGHLVEVRFYDWIFDCLQSLPEKYSDYHTEELTHQLIEKLDLHYWMVADTSDCSIHLPTFSALCSNVITYHNADMLQSCYWILPTQEIENVCVTISMEA
ncbi:MAG: hypothetical protein ACK4TA_11365 [Saprospiraceae bacterium]